MVRQRWLAFQLGRLVGYATLGAVAAASVQLVGSLATHVAVLRPAWSLLHAAALLMGLSLLWQARQPHWVDALAQRWWRRLPHSAVRSSVWGPIATGGLWAFMPCGLLYSAVLVAALAGDAVRGAAVMAAFAVGSAVALAAGPWLWRGARGGSANAGGAWGVRLAGLALAVLSGWALWMALTQQAAPWCVGL